MPTASDALVTSMPEVPARPPAVAVLGVVAGLAGGYQLLSQAMSRWHIAPTPPDGVGDWTELLLGVVLAAALLTGAVLLLTGLSWLFFALSSVIVAGWPVWMLGHSWALLTLSGGSWFATGLLVDYLVLPLLGAALASLVAVRGWVQARNAARTSSRTEAVVLGAGALMLVALLVVAVLVGRSGMTADEVADAQAAAEGQLRIVPGVSANLYVSYGRVGGYANGELHAVVSATAGTDSAELADRVEQVLWESSFHQLGSMIVEILPDQSYDATPPDPADIPQALTRTYVPDDEMDDSSAAGGDRRPLSVLEQRYGPRPD